MCGEEWLTCAVLLQIGFLTEWQLYAQQVEGDAWLGEKLDQGKVAKMSGMLGFFLNSFVLGLILFPAPWDPIKDVCMLTWSKRRTTWPVVRVDAGDTEARDGR
jgi:hypothetical protein